MEIKKGALVALNFYGILSNGRICPANEKRALGKVIACNGMDNGLRSFNVELQYPKTMKGRILPVLEKDLMLLSNSCSDSMRGNLEEAVLLLIRELESMREQLRRLQETGIPLVQ